MLVDSFQFRKIRPGIQTFLGHTRFATSIKATFDGTHPHQWTPLQNRRIYQLGTPSILASSNPSPTFALVENYITHNGDFDFYTVNNVQYRLSTIQRWLVIMATGTHLPSSVDSIAVAGLVDVLRTEGCFGLSARYAVLLNCSSSRMDTDIKALPSYSEFEKFGLFFERALLQVCQDHGTTLGQIKISRILRHKLAASVLEALTTSFFKESNMKILVTLISQDGESADGISLHEVIDGTVDAFFDHDLFQATRELMANTKGSFGLMVTSSLDAHHQICLAACGQPISLAFYPKEGLVAYGSELAAVKVALTVEARKGKGPTQITIGNIDNAEDEYFVKQTCRLDLDDLGGKIVLLDWGCGPNGDDVEVEGLLVVYATFAPPVGEWSDAIWIGVVLGWDPVVRGGIADCALKGSFGCLPVVGGVLDGPGLASMEAFSLCDCDEVLRYSSGVAFLTVVVTAEFTVVVCHGRWGKEITGDGTFNS